MARGIKEQRRIPNDGSTLQMQLARLLFRMSGMMELQTAAGQEARGAGQMNEQMNEKNDWTHQTNECNFNLNERTNDLQ